MCAARHSQIGRQARIALSVIVHPRGVYRTDFGSWPSSGEGRGDAQHLPVREQGLRCCASCGSPPLHMMVLSGRYRALTKVMTVAGAAPDLNSLTDFL